MTVIVLILLFVNLCFKCALCDVSDCNLVRRGYDSGDPKRLCDVLCDVNYFDVV